MDVGPDAPAAAGSAGAVEAPPVMLVEDDAAHAVLIERVFKRAGLNNPLRAFQNGDDAVAYLSGQAQYADRTAHPLPVLALLDLHVPGRSGLDILASMRERSDLQRVPVVMLSGSAESEDINRAFELGAETYLVKPVAFDALLDAISSLGLPWVILGRDPAA